jgi:hypothetical protein
VICMMYVLHSRLTRGVVQHKSMAEAMEDLDSHNEQQPKSTHSRASKRNRYSTPGAHQIPEVSLVCSLPFAPRDISCG